MAETNSTLNRASRYVGGGTTEINQTAIEWWERDQFLSYPDDLTYVVEKKFVGRLDLIAAVYAGEPRYWWAIAMLNNILDPANDVVEGLIIYIPTTERLKGIIGAGKIGGAQSTREVPISILPIV
jgi:hypothetical protein